MSLREEQCKKVCRILDDVLANRPTERDSLIVAVRKAFKALAEPHWIPCSLRLPELSVEVLTYTEMVGFTEIQSLEQDKNGFMYWENQHGDIQDMTVTAWMPMPEVYKG